MKKRTKVTLVVGVLIGAILWWNFKEDCGVGVESVWWLPPEANDITYLKNYVTQWAEFRIEREAFEKWCERMGRPLRELGGAEHRTVQRCLLLLEHRGIIPPISEPNEVERDRLERERVSKHLHGGDLFFEERWANGGGYTLGYDVEEKRGYYEFSHR